MPWLLYIVALLLASSSSVFAEPAAPIDVNTATAGELRELPGVGKVIAERIIERRERLGPYTKKSQLRRVKGIGKATLRKIAPLITLGAKKAPPKATEPAAPKAASAGVEPALVPPDGGQNAAPERGAPGRQPTREKPRPVNINVASAARLTSLEGIGDRRARDIVAWRKVNGPFAEPAALRKVPGITGPVYGPIAERITVLVDLNAATEEELAALFADPVVARRVREHREKVDGFDTVTELARVDAVSEKAYFRVKDLVVVGPYPPPPERD